MAITQRTATSSTVASSAAFSVTLPTGTTTGDLVVLAVANAGTSGPATPTGWAVVLAASAGTGQHLSTFWAPFSAGLTLSFTNAASVAAWTCNAYTGADTLNPISDVPLAASNTTNNSTLPTGAPVTGINPGDYEVLTYAWTSAATITTVATGSAIDKTQANSTSISCALGHNTTTSLAASTTTTAFSQTLSASNSRKSGIGILLRASRSPVLQSASTESTSVSFSSLPQAGNSVIVAITTFLAPSVSSVTDNQTSNTYTSVGTVCGPSPDAHDYCQLWWCPSISTPSGTFTVTATGGASMAILEANGGYKSVDVSDTSTTGASTTITSGSITTHGASELVVCAYALENGTNASAPTGWQFDESQTSTAGEPIAMYHQQQTSAGAISFSGTTSNATAPDWAIVIAAFSTSAPAAAPPAAAQWPLPQAPIFAQDLRTWIVAPRSYYFPTNAPFDLTEWAVPRAAPTSFLLTWILNPSSRFPIPTPAPPTSPVDYPNPRGPSRIVEFLASLDLQQTTLPVVATPPPVIPREWPLPRGPVALLDLRTWFVNLLERELQGQDRLYGAAGQVPTYEPANPSGPAYAAQLRAFIDVLKLPLRGQDRFFGGPGQPPANLDWPPPKGPARGISLWSWWIDLIQSTLVLPTNDYRIPRGLGNLMGTSAPSPFAELDWPVPRGKEFPSTLRTFTDVLKLTLRGLDHFFGAPGQAPAMLDWPLARGSQRVIDLSTWLWSLQQRIPVVLAPFNLLDWSVPGPRPYAVSLQAWGETLQLLFGIPIQRPLVAAPGSNPATTPFPLDLRTWLGTLADTALLVPPRTILSYDWPLPKGKEFPSDLRTFIDVLKLNLRGQDKFFGGPGQGPPATDWPLPKGSAFSVGLRTFADLLKLTLFFGVPVQPPAQLDWPPPSGKVYPVSLRSWLDPLKTDLRGQDTFFGGPGQPPAYEPTTPPTGRVFVLDLRTWLVNLLERGLLPTQFYGAPGQVPTYDWPLQLVRRYPTELLSWLLASLQTASTTAAGVDAVVSSDSASLAITLQPVDAGTGTDIASLLTALAAADAILSDQTGIPQPGFLVLDTATLAETQTLALTILGLEAGILVDVGSIFIPLSGWLTVVATHGLVTTASTTTASLTTVTGVPSMTVSISVTTAAVTRATTNTSLVTVATTTTSALPRT